jgi:hypothetical protein
MTLHPDTRDVIAEFKVSPIKLTKVKETLLPLEVSMIWISSMLLRALEFKDRIKIAYDPIYRVC